MLTYFIISDLDIFGSFDRVSSYDVAWLIFWNSNAFTIWNIIWIGFGFGSIASMNIFWLDVLHRFKK